MARKTADSRPQPSSMYEAIERGIADADRKTSAEYDGLLGSLPRWVPKARRREFERARDDLIDMFGESEAKELLRRFRDGHRRLNARGVRYRGAGALLVVLLDVEREIALGQEVMEDKYLGKGWASQYRAKVRSQTQSENAQHARPGALHECIKQICRDNPGVTWKEVLRALEAADFVTDVTDHEIVWQDGGRTRSTKLKSIPSMITRLKKRISNE